MMSDSGSRSVSISGGSSQMSRVLDQLPVGVALVNDTGELLYLNPAFKEISDAPQFTAAFQKLYNGEPVNDLLSLTRADQNNREVEHIYRLRGFHLDGSDNGNSQSMMLVVPRKD